MEGKAFLIFLSLFCIGLLYLGQGISGYAVSYVDQSTSSSTFYVIYILIGIVLVLMALLYRKMINSVKTIF